MKRQYFITGLLTLSFLFLSFHGVSAQNAPSISGDDVCGASSASACGPQHLKKIISSVFSLFVMIGLPVLIIFVSYRFLMAWIRLQQGNANAYKEAVKEAGQAIGGFIMVVVLFGGAFYGILQYFGVRNDTDFNPLNILKLFSDAFIPHAYAADRYLPNPLTITSPIDFIFSVLRVVMRFVIYPGLIYVWVRSGMQFVIAQGNPEGLKKAKQWLLWAFVTTFVVFSVQGVISAISATATQIIGNQPTQTTQTTSTTTNSTSDGRGTPVAGGENSPCNYNGAGIGSGVISDGVCLPGRGAGSTNTNQFCIGKRLGTVCTTSTNGVGICTTNEEMVLGCYVAQFGDACILDNGAEGCISRDRSSCLPSGTCR